MTDQKAPFLTERKANHWLALRECWREVQAYRDRLADTGSLAGELSAHEESARLWMPPRNSLGAAVLSAFGDVPLFAAFVERMEKKEASDAHFECRAGKASLSWRRHENVEREDGISVEPELPREIAKACGVENSNWRQEYVQGRASAETGAWRLNYRIQFCPVYPEGFDLIVRSMSAPILSALQEAQKTAWLKERSRLLTAQRDREKANVQRLQEHFESAMARGSQKDAQLILAARSGNAKRVQALLALGADPNARSWSLSSEARVEVTFPLKEAALLGKERGGKEEEIIQALLGAGADPDQVDHEGRCALAVAARGSNERAVGALARASLPDAQDFDGVAALAAAAEEGSRACVSILARVATVDLGVFEDHGAAPNPKEAEAVDRADTALARAAGAGELGSCEALIQAGADPRKMPGLEPRWGMGDHAEKIAKLFKRAARTLDERDALALAAAPAGAAQGAPRL
jgi:ankyrin repeat protein